MNDRLPPHSLDAERAVIGCCLNDPSNCIAEAQIRLDGGHFYDVRCNLVWEIIASMHPSEVNIITVDQRIHDANKFPNATDFLVGCCDTAISSAHLPSWLDELDEKRTMRTMLRICGEFSSRVTAGEDPSKLVDEFESAALSIRPDKRQETSIKALVNSAISVIEHQCKNRGAITGITTGLYDLDRLSDGMHPGEMIVVAGFPSTGKTALAVGIGISRSLDGIPTAIFSAEMTPVRLITRAMCSESRINFRDLEEEKLKPMVVTAGRLNKAPLYVERASGMSIGQVMAISRRLKQQHDIKLVVIDYIQLLRGTGDNREQQVASISQGCKAIAMELDVPVLALSQLNDEGKLRESRSIGQDADSIWKLENQGEWQPKIQPVKLRVEKCRDGETGEVELTFMKTITRFENRSKIDESDVPER